MFKISLKAVFWILYPTIMCVQYNNQNLVSITYIYMYPMNKLKLTFILFSTGELLLFLCRPRS